MGMIERQIGEFAYGPISLVMHNSVQESENQIYFSEISKMYPYSSEKEVVTISDLHGLWLQSGKNNSREQNIERLQSLRDIARGSKEIVFWTSGIETEKISIFPFISREKLNRFRDFINKANPDCEVSFICGLSKMTNGNGFDDLVRKKSNSGYEIVVLGSCGVENKRVEKLRDEGRIIHLCSTNRQYV